MVRRRPRPFLRLGGRPLVLCRLWWLRMLRKELLRLHLLRLQRQRQRQRLVRLVKRRRAVLWRAVGQRLLREHRQAR